MIRFFKLSHLSWLMTACSVNALMNFETKSAEELVAIIMANNGDVTYREIKSSPIFDRCARSYTNGNSLGNLINTTGNVNNGLLLDDNGDPIPIVPDEGIILSSGKAESFNNQTSDGITAAYYDTPSTDTQLQDMVEKDMGTRWSVNDACWISFEFKCPSDAYVPVLTFNYVFASEEYYEYANTAFNDAFAWFLNGENIARLPDSETDSDLVSINNVNYETNSKYFIGNDPGENPDWAEGPGFDPDPDEYPTYVWYSDVEADGLTKKLTARGFPTWSTSKEEEEEDWNEIKLIVADVGDYRLDSWVMIEGGTFSCVEFTEAPSVSSAPSSSEPTRSPTTSPSQKPTTSPTGQPSISTMPSSSPSSNPSGQPSSSPTVSSMPSLNPTESSKPSSSPTISSQPSDAPSVSSAPSSSPTISSMPSLNPTESSKPSSSPTISSQPSGAPTVSSAPSSSPSISSAPSTSPTISSKPSSGPTISSQPSGAPTISSAPSSSPTISSKPSLNPTESSKPSASPSVSPSDLPSSVPSISTAPSESPTANPSVSSHPTIEGSYPPSVSSAPSDSPTESPTKSPTTTPTKSPTTSPTDQPSISQSPSGKPSLTPTVSTAPSSSPTSHPSVSSKPSDSPTMQPSVSSKPTVVASSQPSVSSKPTVTASSQPSVSSKPSANPTSQPSVSSKPSSSPSEGPSVSSKPTVTASSQPSVSSKPTVTASSQPSISSKPTGSPTSQPSVSSSPTVTASSQPSISSKPSANPTSEPSVSSQPSGSPTSQPSVSSRPTRVGSSEPSISSAPSIAPASIGPNVVFNDKNGNGVQDEGEPGLPQCDILLYKDGVLHSETTTDDDGGYEFDDLPEGTYFIQVKKDPEYTFSPVTEGGNAVDQDGTTDPVTLELGENIDTWDVGMFIPVTLGNKVFDDLNGNAIQDAGEPGLQGVTVTLVNEAGEEIATQVTGEDGSYLFQGLPPDSYAVQFELPETYAFTPPSNLNMDIIDNGLTTSIPDYASDLNTETGVTPFHVLESGDVDMTYDAAIYRPVAISGVTFHDFNANGIQDDDEPGLDGTTIILHNDDGDFIGMAISEPDGSYSFNGLPPDTYYSVIMPPSPEYLLSPTGAGSTSVFDPENYMSSPVELQSGDSGAGANAGFYKYASISDLVWNDALANGIQDADEIGFDGTVTINLYDSNGSVIQTTQPDSSGSYTLEDLVPGEYEIEFIVDDGYHFTQQDAGDDDTKDSDVDPSGKAQFTLVSGEEKNIAAGITVLASVGPNHVFEDVNGNGIQDEDEPGKPDVVIHLVDGDGNRVATAVSDSNGEYEFNSLPPGNYSIHVELDEGSNFSPVVEGGNQVSQVDDEPYGTSPVVELSVGEQEDSWNVGLIEPVSVGNKVWNDLNGNGIQDAGEPGMQGVTAILVDGSGNTLDTTVTDENGLYLFENLEPGTYAVKFEIPEEYLFTPPAKTTTPITNPVDGSTSYDDVTSDVNVDTGVTDAVFLSSGESNLSFDAGIFIPVNISGTTWHDLNANGVEEEGEPGLPGSTVTLYDRDGDFVAVQITDDEGNFLFEDLPPGTYHTELTPPSPDYLLSPKADDNDSDFNPDNFQTTPITLNSGESGEGSFDGGLYLPAKIGNRVWYDEFMNGIQDGTEKAFDGPVLITLYDSLGYVVETTAPETGSGFYQFDGLTPGTYEIFAEIDELGYVFTMQYKGNDTAIDSDVNPTTGKVTVTVSSGEDNDTIDIGIMDDAPYYPDWTNDNQICTNDGFDPEWLEIQRVNYLYKNKEACCKRHFWWRITQCMQNEEFKFYKNGEICDTKIFFEDWESNSPADWTDTTQFDTLDECCVNMFWYDIDGCMERSPVMFKFEFCVDIKGLVEPQDCQSADMYANVLEDAINAGVNLDADSQEEQDLTDANITSIGNVTLAKEQGSTVCGGSLAGEDFINDKTGITPDIAGAANTITTVCGVITVEDADCTQEDCLRERYQNLTDTMTEYINDGEFKSFLNERANSRHPPVPELQKVSGVEGSFTTSNLLLPATITGDQTTKFYRGSDLTTCSEKTFFLETEVPYDTLHECCKVSFHWDVRSCCINGGGCPELAIDEDSIEYYPTWSSDKLCDSKPSTSFDTWEANRFETIDECCDMFFSDKKAECIRQHDVQ